MVHQNAASRKRLGPFGSLESIRAAHQAMPAAERQKRLAWGQSMIKKEYIRRTWMDLRFLKPFYGNWQGHEGLCTMITKVKPQMHPFLATTCVLLLAVVCTYAVTVQHLHRGTQQPLALAL